ncbi:Uncharacterized protein OS=Aneurinibacillus aneurinilyticus ATCC 12856 GN=HMPREF0083_00370 PE=4 SV=1 [Tuwongella immobilis]|uniref:Uncharacterized protein n=1 Tax=Tuwongella immobilis TaxID=692036 RepID=A0A6C2YJD7_9BACT|nr:Uncharacterized protein OS=Aneurinibacillus aneurinilyticus ATCC 12856 GN=HMPREF0083_00370 PE=4 SV=1 [Tuwongella immobilis]VTR98670.1 Uncharacterized protein OS=Aneurinibacillus aneurinilyticus ATCC 12856 GN=HMPREF0083_00370 PE=4 SV=1 [Tuwongella immobilis]
MLPRHLVNCLSHNVNRLDDFRFETDFICRCGSTLFRWYTVGRYGESDPFRRPLSILIEGKPCFRIENECIKCNHRCLVFDSQIHGWNGFICRNEHLARISRPTLDLWKCTVCFAAGQSARIGIASEGESDFNEFLQSFGDRFNPDDWVDAFGWIHISLRCPDCKTDIPGWVDYETM